MSSVRAGRLMRFVGSALFAVASTAGAQGLWKPEKRVEIVVGSAPGGGNDKTARVIQKTWNDTKLVSALVLNKVGGGGSIAYTFVSRQDDPYFIGVAQAGLITNEITGLNALSLDDVTPLAYVGSEVVALTVAADSPYKNLQQFLAQLKKDPSSLAISVGSTLGGTNHFAVALLAKSVGVDPRKLKVVVFGGGGESVVNVLGHHVSAMSQLANNSIQYQQAGTMRILCITARKRLAVIPDVPTCTEQGADVVMEGWTVMIGPKKMTPAQVAGWEDILRKTTQHADWKAYVEANAWQPGFMDSKEATAYLKRDHAQTKALLTELGLAK